MANNSIIDEPLGPAIEQLAKEIVSDVVMSRLLEEEENRHPPYAVQSNTDTNVADADVSNEIGRIIDEKWEDKRVALELAMAEKIKKEVEKQERERTDNNLRQVNLRITQLEQAKAQEEKPTDNQSPSRGSFGRRRRMLEDAQKEAAPSKEQFDSLSGQVDSIKLDQDAMKKDTEANTQAVQEMQGRLLHLENPPPSTQVNATIPDAAAAPTARAEEPAADVVGCDREEVDNLITKTDDHEKRIESIENVFTHIKPEDLWNFIVYATNKFDEFDGYFSELPDQVQEIKNTQAGQADLLNETVSKQKECSEQQQTTQQKGASDQDTSDLKEQAAARDKEIADLKAENTKLAEASAQQGKKIDSLEAENKKLVEANAEQDRQIEIIKADAAAKTAQFNDEQKVQNDRLAALEQSFAHMAATFQQFPGPNQQQPQLVPQQPSPPAPQGNGPWTPSTTPPNQTSDPVPELDVQMEDGDGLDSEMMDAPAQPEQPVHFSQPPQPPHVPQQSQVPQPPQQFQEPQLSQQSPRQPLFQPQQPSTSTPRDTPMANAGPIFPNSNGSVGGAQQPQPMAGSQPFPRNGPILPSPSTPSGSAPQPSRQHLGPIIPQPPSSGSVPSQPTPSTPAPAAPAAPTPAAPTSQKGNLFAKSLFSSGSHNVNPNQFNFNTAPPAVNMPQIDWDAQAGKLKVDFDPPSDLDDDDDELLNPKGQMPQAAATPVTPSTGQTATKNSSPGNTGASSAAPVNGASSSNAPAPPMANNAGSSSTTGSPSTRPKLTPKPQKKKPSPFIQRKPAATPSKPAEVTNKAQSTQTPAASLAAKRQAAFQNLYNTPATPSPAPVAPLQPAGGQGGFFIPGHTGAPNNSPFALKPKTPASNTSSSPYKSQSRTHDTVESSSPVNVFLKEVVVVPEAKTGAAEASAPEAGATEPAKLEDNGDDIYMSDSDSKPKAPAATTPEGTDNDAPMSDFQSEPATSEAPKPEAPKPEAPKPEANSPKPFHEPDHNPRKHINSQDVPVAKPADPMQTDRKLVKGKGIRQRLTPAQATEEAWDAYDRALSVPPPLPPTDSQEDEVDYADPNDFNDKDVHTTVMAPSKKVMKPTKYSTDYFLKWKKGFCAVSVPNVDESYADGFRKHLNQLDMALPLDKLVEQAGFPRVKRAYERPHMESLMKHWFEQVFLGATGAMAGRPVEGEQLKDFRQKLKQPMKTWFAQYAADTI